MKPSAAIRRKRRLLDALLASIPERPKRFSRLWKRVSDPDGFLTLAQDENVLTVILGALREKEGGPAGLVGQEWQAKQAVFDWWHPALLRKTHVLVAELKNRGIRTCVLKGAALAERIYPSPSSRASGDIDLLVAERDLEAACEVARSMGYEEDYSVRDELNQPHPYHIAFRDDKVRRVEIHYRLHTGFATAVPSEPFLRRYREWETKGGPLPVLCPEDELLYLAIHAAGHIAPILNWLCDLKLYQRAFPDLRYATVHVRAETHRQALALSFACAESNRRLGCSFPAPPLNIWQRTRLALALWAYRNGFVAGKRHRWKGVRGAVQWLGRVCFEGLLCDRLAAGLHLVGFRLCWAVAHRLGRWPASFASALDPNRPSRRERG